ncbi:MAG: AmmeMemoRadiSam system protein B [Elusimicrobiota bacterium]
MIRKAVYSGTWYPSGKKEIEAFIIPDAKKQKSVAAFCPHAGWVYSGKVAGEVFSSIEPVKLYILIGPNHRGMGAPVGIWSEGAWMTPLGELEIEDKVAKAILKKSNTARSDFLSHAQEHSLEVQLPFIKYFSPGAKIVPVSLADYSPATCRELGEAAAAAIKENGFTDDAVIVASTDMSHYVSAEQAKKSDNLAIRKILDIDPKGLLETVKQNDISMCGSGPAAAALWAAKILGAKSSKLIRYSTSGDVTGDSSEVVGYAGIIVY